MEPARNYVGRSTWPVVHKTLNIVPNSLHKGRASFTCSIERGMYIGCPLIVRIASLDRFYNYLIRPQIPSATYSPRLVKNACFGGTSYAAD